MNKKLVLIQIVFEFIGTLLFANSVAKLKPLATGETLSCLFDNGTETLYISKEKFGKKDLYYSVTNTGWGMYRISDDKRNIVFFKNSEFAKKPMFYLNGEKGLITFIGNIQFGACTDTSGEFVIFQESDLGDFYIMNLKSKKVEKQIKWELNDKENWCKSGARFYLLRSIEKEDFDFIIDFEIEYLSIAKAYVNIKKGELYIDYDDSDKWEVDLRESVSYESEYTGFLGNF